MCAAGLSERDAARLHRHLEDAPALARPLRRTPRDETPRPLPSDVWVWVQEAEEFSAGDPLLRITLASQMREPQRLRQVDGEDEHLNSPR